MYIAKIIGIVWSALTPYVGIYLSALLINELSGARDPKRLTTLVVLTLTSAALITLVTILFNKWKDLRESAFWYKINKMFSDKMLDMDFVDEDDPKTHQLLSTIYQNMTGSGWGLYRLYRGFDSLLSSILSLFGGIAMTVTLFTRRVPDSAGAYTALNNPLFIVAIIAVMLAVTFISPMLGSKGESFYAQNAGQHNLANRLFGFYGFLGSYYPEAAADARIYRMDKICEVFNKDKTGTFCSKGPFAKIAKKVTGFYSAGSAAVSVIFTGCAYVFVCMKALAGAFGIGEVTQYVSSITRVSGNVSSIVSCIGEMKNNAEFLKITLEYFDIPNNMYEGSLSVEKRSDRNYEIEFRDVSFKYPGSDT